jgi:glycosyltransferase involved in cell wall biosynthesis
MQVSSVSETVRRDPRASKIPPRLVMSPRIREYLQHHKVLSAMVEMKRAFQRTLVEWDVRIMRDQVATLKAHNPLRGRALLSYRIEAFVLPSDDPTLDRHTNYWQSAEMANVLAELGYEVDVIDYRNTTFVPEKRYDICIDVRNNLERLAPLLGPECLKIFHIDTAHLLIHNAKESARLASILERRGAVLPTRTQQPSNCGIETAACATGNVGEFAMSTFRYAGKKIYPVPAPIARTYGWSSEKDWLSARRRFIWYGSRGLVHKGLDLVLEAFAAMPDLELVVCGPIDQEPEFVKAYYPELYETPNIETVGWVDTGGRRFREIVDSCTAVVFPSCSEGLSTSTLECMHAGLIPVVTHETGVPAEPFGFEIESLTVNAVQSAVRAVTALSPEQLRKRSELAWAHANEHHTRERFSEVYRRIMINILGPLPSHEPSLAGEKIKEGQVAYY